MPQLGKRQASLGAGLAEDERHFRDQHQVHAAAMGEADQPVAFSFEGAALGNGVDLDPEAGCERGVDAAEIRDLPLFDSMRDECFDRLLTGAYVQTFPCEV